MSVNLKTMTFQVAMLFLLGIRVVYGQITLTSNSTMQAEYSSLELKCTLQSNVDDYAIWKRKRPGDTYEINIVITIISGTDQCNSEIPAPPSYMLCSCRSREYTCIIKDLTRDQNGDQWRCTSGIGPQAVSSTDVTLQLLIGITGVTLSPASTVKIIAGSTGTLVCKTSGGLPSATVSWFRRTSTGDVNITSMSESISSKETGLSVVTSTLTLRPPKDNNSMLVICSASNGGTTHYSGTGTIDILYEPTTPVCTYRNAVVNGDIMITRGSTLSITCLSTSNPSSPNYRWTVPDSTTQTGPSLSITDIQPSRSGQYRLLVWNTMTPTVGTSRNGTGNATFTIVVQYSPMAPTFKVSSTVVTGLVKIIEGQDQTFRCESQSNPPASYTWTYPRGTVTGQNLTLSNPLGPSDNGTFSCKAENTLTPTGESSQQPQSSSSILTVEILYPPRVPQFKYSSTSGMTIPGNTIKIVRSASLPVACIADSNPTPYYQWEIQTGNSQLLSLNQVLYSTNRTCTARSMMIDYVGNRKNGTNRALLNIIVLYPPETPHVTFYYKDQTQQTNISSLNVLEGDSFNFKCMANSNPESRYSWNDTPETSHGIYNVTNISKTPAKLVATCSAHNAMETSYNGTFSGSNTKDISISVLYGPRALALTPLDALQGTRLEQKCLFNPGNPEQTYFRWTRSTNTNTWKVQTDQTLVINNVTRSDDGNYTCQVYNMLNPTVGTSENRTDEKWFLLNVLYGAENMTFSTDVVPGTDRLSVSENTKVAMTCKLDSNPGSFMNISKGGEVLRTVTNTKMLSHQLNGKCEDAGVYTCVGHNHHPGSPSQLIDIKVLCSPRHAPGEVVRNVSSRQHETPTIKLYIQAYPTPTHRWARCWNGMCSEIQSSSKYIMSSEGLEANLTVVNVEQADFGQYQLTAMNGVGKQLTESVWLILAARPEMPRYFFSTQPLHSQSSVMFYWLTGYNGGDMQTFYIEYKRTDSQRWDHVSVVEDKSVPMMNFTVDNLSPATRYQARIYAINKIGSSDISDPITFTMLDTSATQKSVTQIGFIVGGVVPGLLLVGVIAILIYLRLTYNIRFTKKSQKSHTTVYDDLSSRNEITNRVYDGLSSTSPNQTDVMDNMENAASAHYEAL
ncbi:hypothetical protein DPMN_042124, partial [Dreissena polymorpha]